MQSEVLFINPEQILPNIYQPRKYFDDEAIEELAQSIKAYGIIQPLSVRKMGIDKFELVAGERRLRAAKSIGLHKVPAIVIDITDKESAAIALLENLQREDLNYIEEAEAYYNLIKDHSYTQEQLAGTIGKKQSTIANKLRLLRLSPVTRKVLLENKLTERHARALLRLSSEEKQIQVLRKIIQNKFNVKESERLIEKEINKEQLEEVAVEGKKKIKGVFASKVYINTIKQVFDKYGINAQYKSKELEDCVEVTITIPKNK